MKFIVFIFLLLIFILNLRFMNKRDKDILFSVLLILLLDKININLK